MMKKRIFPNTPSFGSVAMRLAGSLAVSLSCWSALAQGPFLNGFDLSNAIIPVSQIVRGGPPRDGIPAIDNPKFLSASEVSFMQEDDLVIALDRGGIADRFIGIIASEDVAHSKPDPEPYLRATELLGMEPGEIVAIEDSTGGILSARAAGLAVVAVAQSYDEARLRDLSDAVVARVGDLGPSVIENLAGSRA